MLSGWLHAARGPSQALRLPLCGVLHSDGPACLAVTICFTPHLYQPACLSLNPEFSQFPCSLLF